MSKPSRVPKVPSYRLHKPSGQAVVTIRGRDIYLGKHDTPASRSRYDQHIGEWLAAGRTSAPDPETPLSVAELVLQYLNFAKSYYQKNGKPTGAMPGIRVALRILRQTYGHTPAIEFGPLKLKALQQKMIGMDQSRRYLNDNIDRIRRVFRWGASEELIPPSVYQGLQAVPGLRKGRTKVREVPPIGPVDDAVVEDTIPHLPEVIADMVRLQRLTGCRPAEVCMIRPCDVDTADDVWIYRPKSHKTEHHGRERVICIGPKAQEVLQPYLSRNKKAYCFSPTESEQRRLALLHATRKTPLSCGNRPGTNRKRRPKKKPGDCYDTNAYRRAIHRAVDAANKDRKKQNAETGVKLEMLPRWSPNRLRHTAATEIRRVFGLEAAQVALGHSQADVTQIYAEKDLTLASEVARKIG